MRFHCIADEDTVRGFRLAGVSGQVATLAAEAGAAIRRVLTSEDCGVLILTEKVADSVRPLVDQIRFEQNNLLVVEIAGPEGELAGHKSLPQLVQTAIGIRLEQGH